MAISDQQIFDWFLANPGADDATIASTMDQFKLTPEDIARATGTNLSNVQSRYEAVAPVVGAPTNTVTNAPVGIASLNTSANNAVEPVNDYVDNTDATTSPTVAKTPSAADLLAQKILAQNTASKWTGEGFGSAAANAADMAKILAGIGITDLNQFGQITKEVPTYDEEGNQTGTQKLTTYGNKLTGQEVPNTYGERQSGNAFGGTYAGSGNTGYRVQFDAQGNPYFYTTGASSNDLANIMQDLGPIGNIALAVATGGLSIPEQLAVNAALQLASGKDIGDIAKGTAASYLGSQIPGLDVVKDATSVLNGIDSTGILSSAAQNAAISGGKALITGQDVGNAMLSGAAAGGTNGAVNALLNNVEGFNTLTPAQKKMAVNAVTGVVSGKPLDQVVINTAIAAANNAVKDAKATKTADASDVIGTLQNAGLTDGYADNQIPGLSVAEQRSNALTTIYDYNNNPDTLSVNLVSPTQLAAGEGYTGGLPKPEFKPNQVNIDTATGKAFFTTIDTSGVTKNIPVVIDGSTGKLLTSSENSVALERALGASDIPRLSFSSELMRALQVLNPAIGDRTIIPTSSIVTQAELDALLGKEAIDVTAKDVTGADTTGKNKSPFSSAADVLKTFGSLDVAETAMGLDALMKIPGIQDYRFNQYLDMLKDELSRNPNDENLRAEYYSLVGDEYVQTTGPVTDFGTVVVTGKRDKDNVVAKSPDGTPITYADLQRLVGESPFAVTGETTKPSINVSPTTPTVPKTPTTPTIPTTPTTPTTSTNPTTPTVPEVDVIPTVVAPVVTLTPSVVPPTLPVVTPTTPVVTPTTPVVPSTPPVVPPTTPVVPPTTPVVPTTPPVVPPEPPVVPPKPPVVPPETPVVTPETPVVPPTPPVVTPTPPVVKPPVVTPPVVVPPTVKSTTTNFTMPQAESIAAAFGLPQLANVFYYGKDFGSKKQKLDKKGELEEEEYKPLSVTAPGAAGELVEEQKNKENNTNDALDLILGKSGESMSVDDLLNIVKGG